MSKINEKLIHDLIILRNNMEDCLFQVPRASYTNLALNSADGSASIVFFTTLPRTTEITWSMLSLLIFRDKNHWTFKNIRILQNFCCSNPLFSISKLSNFFLWQMKLMVHIVKFPLNIYWFLFKGFLCSNSAKLLIYVHLLFASLNHMFSGSFQQFLFFLWLHFVIFTSVLFRFQISSFDSLHFRSLFSKLLFSFPLQKIYFKIVPFFFSDALYLYNSLREVPLYSSFSFCGNIAFGIMTRMTFSH